METWHRAQRRPGFTLVELLVVIGILAVLSTLVFTYYDEVSENSNRSLRDKEMADIQAAFGRFYEDCQPTSTQMEDIRVYGLWPLFQENRPDHAAGTKDFPDYDTWKKKGWRGPYMVVEDSRGMDTTPVLGMIKSGQRPGSGTTIPVIFNPWGNAYRILMPQFPAGTFDKARLVLVCPGAVDQDGDGDVLDTTDVTTAADDEIKVGDKVDDKVLRLLPALQKGSLP